MMTSRFNSRDRPSTESARPFLGNDDEVEEYYEQKYPVQTYSPWRRLFLYLTPPVCMPRRLRRSWRTVLYIIASLPYLVIALVVFTSIFLPSYTHRPAHYDSLSRRCAESTEPGRANVHGEKIFIAASIYDEEGTLVGGDWGRAVLKLIDLLGPDNVYLSVYENDPDQKAKLALEKFKKEVKCRFMKSNANLAETDLEI
jgi:hypothetical protein